MNKFKILCLTISSLVILIMASCSEDVYEGAYKPSLESYYFSVYPRDFEFGSGEETKSGSITSENAWSFSSVPAWLSLSPTSGNSNAEFSITSTANESMSSKTAVFFISTSTSGWSQQRTITASQAAASPFFNFADLESTSLYLTGESHTLTIDVETNIDDLATKVYDAESWLSASYQNKQLTITVDANNDGYERSGRVQLWSSLYSKGGTIYITQYKPNFSFNEITSLSFDADGGTQYVNVSSEIPWVASSNESWIEITPAEGNAGDNQVKITVLPSYQSESRNGRALFYYRDNSSTDNYISITQTGRYINLTPNTITLSAEENSTASIDIDSNIGWGISSYPDWLELSQNKGDSGKTSITVSAQKNNSLNSRTGTISIKDSGTGGIQSDITVTQTGLDFRDNTTLEFSWHQSSLELNIPIPGDWSAAVSDGWISLSDYIGNGNKTITVTVSKNDAEDLRTGKILFSSEGKTFEITVIQTGQYLLIDKSYSEIGAMGGQLILSVSTSVSISSLVEYVGNARDWITLNVDSNGDYIINVKNNQSINNRDAYVVLTPNEQGVSGLIAQGVKLAIKQKGRNISADVIDISMHSNGGTSETYHIEADGNYSIEKASEDFWYTLIADQVSNTFYVIGTKNTTGIERIGKIMVSLLDVPAGEDSKSIQIAVRQVNTDYNIYIDDYDDDEILY